MIWITFINHFKSQIMGIFIYILESDAKDSSFQFETYLQIWKIPLFSYFPGDGPWPDLTQAYFWSSVNKRPTRLWPGYFVIWLEEIFFWPEVKKIDKFDIFRGNFPNPNPNHKWLTRPNPTLVKKFLTWTHHQFFPSIISKVIFL